VPVGHTNVEYGPTTTAEASFHFLASYASAGTTSQTNESNPYQASNQLQYAVQEALEEAVSKAMHAQSMEWYVLAEAEDRKSQETWRCRPEPE
jgi:hypothetical protein